MDEAQLIFMRNATKPRKECWNAPISVVCPGKEIPKWFSFSYQSEGSSVHIKLPPDFFRTGLLGFVLSIAVSCVSSCNKWFVIRAGCNVKSLGESHGLFTSRIVAQRNSRILNDCCDDGQDHVYMWYESVISEEEAEMRSPNVYKLANEASVEFRVGAYDTSVKVKRCGICPLYAEDVEKFKLDRVFISGEPKIQEETREDETWEASGSSYEAQLYDGESSYESESSYECGNDSEASKSSYDQFELNESDDESEANGSSL